MPVALHMIDSASTFITFLGVEIDIVACQLSLAELKLLPLNAEIAKWYSHLCSALSVSCSRLLVSSKSRPPVMKYLVREMEWNQLHTNTIPNPTYSVRCCRFMGPFVLQPGFKCNGHQTGKKRTTIKKLVPIVAAAGLCMGSELA